MSQPNDLEVEITNLDEGIIRNNTNDSIAEIVHTPESNVFVRQSSALASFATSCKLEWSNIDVFLGDEKTGQQILHNFHGMIQSGELLAVMGGSGAGKTTFLNALSGRTNLNRQTVNGYMAINGKKFKCSDQKLIKSICTFVPQSDELCPTQTVEEALQFYAKLKLTHCSKEKQQKRVDFLIDVLYLNKCRNNYIGSESKRGISGGEKRRVSIAAEILNDKDIIYLDEPTSGLDAYTAARTIKTLKQFCIHSNKTIIATIHQPSIEVFYLFDKLILLANGKCCFNSYIKDVDEYFSAKLRPRTNPADVIVFEVQKHSDLYANKWANSTLNEYTGTNISQINYNQQWENYEEFDLNDSKNSITIISETAPQILQHGLLLQREFKGIIRNKRVTLVRFIQVVFFAFASGLCYFDVERKFMSRVQSFFLMTIMCLLFGIVSLLTEFPAHKLLFQREYNSQTYNIIPWALSFMIIEIPREMIHMCLFTVITYFMIDLDGNIVLYWINFFLLSIAGGSFGIFFGTICRTTIEAAQTVPAALIPLLIFSDSFVRLQSIPTFLQWFGVINPLYYLLRCLYIIEFYGVVYPRTLPEHFQEACEAYNSYQNQSLPYNITYVNSNSNSSVYNNSLNNGSRSDCVNVIILRNNTYVMDQQLNIDEFYHSKINMFFDFVNQQITDQNISINTTNTEEQQKIDLFCSKEAPYNYFFDAFGLHKSQLVEYWLKVLLICFVLRVAAILILLAINNNVFSLIYSKVSVIIKCQCFNSQKYKSNCKAIDMQINHVNSKQTMEVRID